MHPIYENRNDEVNSFRSYSITFPEHLHQHLELLYVVSGIIEVTVMSETKMMHPGELVLIFPNQIHSYHSEQENETIIVLFDRSVTGKMRSIISQRIPENSFLPPSSIHQDIPLALHQLLSLTNSDNGNLKSAWIQIICAHLLEEIVLKERSGVDTNDLIYHIIQYIMEHYREPLSLDSLSTALNINKFYLSHIFSIQLQISYKYFLAHLGTEYAIHLMKTTSITITDIWKTEGLASQRRLNRI